MPLSAAPKHTATIDRVFRGTGEMAGLVRAFDWATTPLGPIGGWSASLRTTVSTLLATRHAMFLFWGPGLVQFYNDAFRRSLGHDRHPSALGQGGMECWKEIWSIIGREVDDIMAGGEATWHEDHLVPITRGDRVDDVHWSYSYSPVSDDDGEVGGVLVTVQETTLRVISERRARLLQELASAHQHAQSADEVYSAALTSLRTASGDIGFALLYAPDHDAGNLRLAGSVGLPLGAPLAPRSMAMDSAGAWPVPEMLGPGSAASMRITLQQPVHAECWQESVRDALTAPLGPVMPDP
ncbi:MAG: PAS domain-containing protein [Gemmatimonadales bacterium]|nr:PAS domain-containing protein [Gemmatimonadales bacterium]